MLTSALKSSRGNPSTALMHNWDWGWTIAKPPDTATKHRKDVDVSNRSKSLGSLGYGAIEPSMSRGLRKHTEELLGSSALFYDLDKAWFQLLDGGDVIGKDAHISWFSSNIDLDTIVSPLEGTCQCFGSVSVLSEGWNEGETYTSVDL
jgi:hypothetical protein